MAIEVIPPKNPRKGRPELPYEVHLPATGETRKVMPSELGPMSVCTCGHTGDGRNSQHYDTVALGHGACKICTCKKFTWSRWIGLPEKPIEPPLVREFFIRRFKRKPEHDPSYFEEWVERFRGGRPEQYMDRQSREVYQQLISEKAKAPLPLVKEYLSRSVWDDINKLARSIETKVGEVRVPPGEEGWQETHTKNFVIHANAVILEVSKWMRERRVRPIVDYGYTDEKIQALVRDLEYLRHDIKVFAGRGESFK